jgi:hypothetical protein
VGVPAYAQPRSDPGGTVDVDDDPAEPGGQRAGPQRRADVDHGDLQDPGYEAVTGTVQTDGEQR